MLVQAYQRTELLTPLGERGQRGRVRSGIVRRKVRCRVARCRFGKRHAWSHAESIGGLRARPHTLPVARIAIMQDNHATFKLGLSDDQTLNRPTRQSDA